MLVHTAGCCAESKPVLLLAQALTGIHHLLFRFS